MDTPTIAELCAAVPDALFPAAGFAALDQAISAVHVSELVDPTAYLSGGELLLTTGLAVRDRAFDCDEYVTRLCSAGLAALGLGLGPTLDVIPPALAAACTKHGLCLVVVPPTAAFLTVTKAYWRARSRSTERELNDAISAHRSLVDAMVSSDPVGATMKALARVVGGWVARLDSAAVVERVYPAGRIDDAVRLADQLDSMRAAGVHASTTLASGDETITVFPLALDDRVVGHLAIGAPKRLEPTARRLVLTASALLSLDSVRRQRADSATQAQMQSVAILLDMGFIDAARRLAARVGLPSPRDSVRVLVVDSPRTADVVAAVQSWMPAALPGPPESERCWFVLLEPPPSARSLIEHFGDLDLTVGVAVSDPIGPAGVHAARIALFDRVMTLEPGVFALRRTSTPSEDAVHAAVRRVADHRRADLIATLVAYLRHRGQWDPAARELGVHRNTVRHRVDTITTLTRLDLADPDVSAIMWICLRSQGLT